MPTLDDFDTFVDKFECEALTLFRAKNKEYATTSDCFDNFNVLAQDTGQKRETIALIFAHKHWRSVQQAIASGDYGNRVESIRGRFIDLANYIRVMAMMVEERLREEGARDAGQ